MKSVLLTHVVLVLRDHVAVADIYQLECLENLLADILDPERPVPPKPLDGLMLTFSL